MNLLFYFSEVSDPRCGNAKRHLLSDILLVALCAMLCGAQSRIEIAEYERSKQAALKQWLALPNGIPSHDTFARVFSLLNPQQLGACFTRLLRDLSEYKAQRIAIDCKCLRGSQDPTNQQAAFTWSAPGPVNSIWC